MPSVLLYLAVLLAVIIVWFMFLKRPVYEAIAIALAVLLTLTGTWGNLGAYLSGAMRTSLLYSMIAFVAMSIILTKTKVIDGCINIILALLGRIPGGAGYVSCIASSFMGSLSGSGPGNVIATGVITIPVMKKTGYPAGLAGNIESISSAMGNMIPPSGNIVAALGALTALYPEMDISTGTFWIVLWGISFWFILLRLVTIFGFVKYYKIRPMDESDIPDLKQSLKENWQGLLLPVIILVPFILDSTLKDTFFTARLGATGAKYFSSSLLLFTAGVASIYTLLITPDKKSVTPHKVAMMFAKSVKSIVPTIAVCIAGYTIGNMFADLNVAEEMEVFITGLRMGKFAMVIFMCILTCLLGLVITGSSQIVIFGSAYIASLAAVGMDPVLAAAMLPCICGVMSLITPPMGLCMYAAMSISGADFDEAFKNNLWWVAGQFILQVVIMMGWLPILGL